MLTRFLKNVGCCLGPKASGVVVPAEGSDSADGYEFVEVKPSRVLRVRHIIPERPVAEEPSGQGGSFSFKRKITLTFNGQLLIQNLGDRLHAERKKCDNGDAEANSGKHLSDSGNSSPSASRMKPRRTVIIDCERKISSCKGTHADVTLFFFHGVGGSLDIWGSQLDFFYRQGYEVVAVDLAGHGGSSAPQIAAAYTFYALAEDIRIIFKRYARKRNILIGHSYGVSFCAFLAHEYPELIHKMVLINGGSPTALEPSSCSFFNLPTCVFHCFSPLLRWVFFKGGFAHHGAKEKQLLKDNNAFNVSPFVLHAMMNGQYWPEGDEFYHAEITVPTLLVHGLHDKFISVEDEQYMAEILLMAFLKVVEDGSHMVMMECPETINTLLHEFFLWEPVTPSPPKKESKTRPETAKARCDKTTATAEPSIIRPATANQKASTGNG